MTKAQKAAKQINDGGLIPDQWDGFYATTWVCETGTMYQYMDNSFMFLENDGRAVVISEPVFMEGT